MLNYFTIKNLESEVIERDTAGIFPFLLQVQIALFEEYMSEISLLWDAIFSCNSIFEYTNIFESLFFDNLQTDTLEVPTLHVWLVWAT